MEMAVQHPGELVELPLAALDLGRVRIALAEALLHEPQSRKAGLGDPQ
jgi:hypothetical protein